MDTNSNVDAERPDADAQWIIAALARKEKAARERYLELALEWAESDDADFRRHIKSITK